MSAPAATPSAAELRARAALALDEATERMRICERALAELDALAPEADPHVIEAHEALQRADAAVGRARVELLHLDAGGEA
mgnify:CR=1 FL=1